MTKPPNDQRADLKNPKNAAYEADRRNRIDLDHDNPEIARTLERSTRRWLWPRARARPPEARPTVALWCQHGCSLACAALSPNFEEVDLESIILKLALLVAIQLLKRRSTTGPDSVAE